MEAKGDNKETNIGESLRESRKKRIRGRQRGRIRGRPNKRIRGRPRKRITEIKQLKGRLGKNQRQKEEENEEQKINESNDVFKESKKKYLSKGLFISISIDTNSSILKKYEEINEKYLNDLNNINIKKKYEALMQSNMQATNEEKAKEYGDQLFSILTTNLTKKVKYVKKPNLFYGKSLDDEEFLKLVKLAKDYSINTKTSKQNETIVNRFIIDKKYIINLFKKEKIIKDILQNAILSILINEFDGNELTNNFNYLKIEDVSPCPLIFLPFQHDNKNYDLNKEKLKQEATSYMALLTFNKTMKEFCKDYTLNKEQLKEKIENYVEAHEIYFS